MKKSQRPKERKARYLFLLILMIACFTAFRNEGTTYQSSPKIWILFHERISKKPDLSKFADAAITRRLVRTEVPFDESDLPVEREYVDAVKAARASVLRESRWLHGVSARCDASCQEKISELPFVREIRPVITYRRPNEPIHQEQISNLHSAAKLKYGQAKEQLTQIGVPSLHKKGFAGQGEIVAIFDGGFRKDHIAFQNQVVLAEKDFVFGDEDVSNGTFTDSHGTGTWSCVGGEAPGKLYGPAYRAQFLLAATEDIRSETQVEEDNWVAALEWADELGASVISSSLGYSDWYSPSDYDGATAITSKVASKAAKKGIVVVNSAGNAGPEDSTIVAPADTKNILAVGAINFIGTIATFSSRGPTADGRIKPEVVARGVSVFVASSDTSESFGRSQGTSFACPLVAGAAATLLSAHPDWKPLQVREALMESASQAATPDNTFGSGIVNLSAASEYLPKKSVVIDNHKPLKNTSSTTKPYRVSARIRAQRGIDADECFVFWRKQGTSGFQQVSFVAITSKPDTFEAFIPPQSSGSTIEYYLQARDLKKKKNSLPFGSPEILYSFKVL